MLSQNTHPDGIIEIHHEGHFTLNDWEEYQTLMLSLLDASDKPLFILTNFTKSTQVDKEVLRYVGTAKHLLHPNLGLLVLLGSTYLHSLILQVADSRASKEQKNQKMRIVFDRDQALATLQGAMEG